MAGPRNHVELVEQLAVPPWSGANGLRYVGIVLGLSNDYLAEAAATAASAQWLVPYRGTSPDERPVEGLDLIGAASGLPRYSGESYAAYQSRLLERWTLYTQGAKATLISELEAAGFVGVTVEVPNDSDPRPSPADYWSRCWIRFPLGSHPVTGPSSVTCGVAVCGINRIAPSGFNGSASSKTWRLIKRIVARTKPAQWVVWDYKFEYAAGDYINLQGKRRLQDADYIYNET